jgi:hypothetical protein
MGLQIELQVMELQLLILNLGQLATLTIICFRNSMTAIWFNPSKAITHKGTLLMTIQLVKETMLLMGTANFRKKASLLSIRKS